VALAACEAGPAERHALVHRHVVSHLGGLADHDAGAVVDEEAASDPGGGVDLHPGHDLHEVRQHARNERYAGLVQGVRDAVRQDRLHAPVGEQDLQAADAARRRIALLGRGEVLAQLAGDPGECPDADHGTKKGVLT
jgi:hypothetical protein